MRIAARIDLNQPEIVRELRDLGFDVDHVHTIKGFCDIIVSGIATWSNGEAVGLRVEIKNGKKAKLTPDEVKYWKNQKHRNLIIARCTEDVLKWFGRLESEL